ncbi:hypothetical protein A2572_02040 [Candidatus Collierbacteria bacterium RIFOXYD1_FULL_40_9]|uniref:Cell envelope-related transcriptional attenuator domain-containing protein n=1 Tax=Candidatus Collierbacteria bacterium RIFOXYD1_FULL_40_9 TaxID=1817731 RepID=A0A1F5FTF2_9BACT|nr:MAG: hypothetical protein A2572_02040 [Candidatus Collierbacteria bacterium RIFOXYD1_FULL_40_9]
MFFKNNSLSRIMLHIFFLSKKYFHIFTLFFLLTIGFYGYTLGSKYLSKLEIKPKDLLNFFSENKEKLNSQAGITNFLVLGIRGEGTDSPNLTDSIILASLNQQNDTLTQIGIPRDLWVPSIRDKINTAYHYGQEATTGGGISLVEASIYEVTGQPINYTAIINFSFFKQVIDLIGGLDIYVSPGFVDNEFPIPGKENSMPVSSRFETISFPEGLNHLDGETALKFVRSRHSPDDQGTDFARSKRQQQIISAIKEKLTSTNFFLDENKVSDLIDIAKNNLITNLPPSHYPTIARIALDLNKQNIRAAVLDTTPDVNGISILYNPPISKTYDNKWVLIPKDNNWKALKLYIEKIISSP